METFLIPAIIIVPALILAILVLLIFLRNKISKIIALLLVVSSIVFQRPISEFLICTFISYDYLGEKYQVDTLDKIHISKLDKLMDISELDNVDVIIQKSLNVTNCLLHYKLSGSKSTDPNIIMDRGYGHCGNYSILFSTIANHYLKQNNLSKEYKMNIVYVKDRWFGRYTIFNSHVSCVLVHDGHREHIDPTFYDYNKIKLTNMQFTDKNKKIIDLCQKTRK
jgi:hypothetical protein